MEVRALALHGLAEPTMVGLAFPVIEETGPAIVATLDDMRRYSVDVDARTPGHGGSPAESEPLSPS